ncbi:MAG: hypothetical protein J7501_04095 [Bdellovibrio sp.]|nr:hypothetical protein [Bdellovibrio sp.]
MKSLTTALIISFFALNTFAASFAETMGWGNPGRGGGHGGGWDRPNVTCSATDKGWEEHWGGHSDCNSCLKKHGSCIETCSADYYVTTAEGLDYRGYKMTVESRGNSRYQTEREAIERCSYFYRYNNCRVLKTESRSETVSRRSCR